jgi:RNA polymerase sigma factor (sigma-70 family)
MCIRPLAPKAPTEEERLMAGARRQQGAAARAASRGDQDRATRHQRRARALERRLWALLGGRVRGLARAFASYARRAGLEVEDLQAEAYLRFREVIPRWQPRRGSGVWPFLRRVLANHFIHLGRRRREQPCPDLSQVPGPVAAAARSFEAADALRAAEEQLRAGALGGRPELLEAFKLYWVEDWTIPALAQRYGVAWSTMHSRLREVRRAFVRACGRTSS